MQPVWPKPRRVVRGVVMNFDECLMYHRGHEWRPRYARGVQIKKFQLACLLVVRKLTAYELFNALYGDDPEGGPVYGPKIIYVLLHQLRIVLRKLELRLHRDSDIPCDRFRHQRLWIAP